eukprot:snap_masked-scaffold_16-processed-gene-6.52-mRNA-1 protein AED:1.00 eAED:1.00 QI:0/0/0/0/1/1/4/0/132
MEMMLHESVDMLYYIQCGLSNDFTWLPYCNIVAQAKDLDDGLSFDRYFTFTILLYAIFESTKIDLQSPGEVKNCYPHRGTFLANMKRKVINLRSFLPEIDRKCQSPTTYYMTGSLSFSIYILRFLKHDFTAV